MNQISRSVRLTFALAAATAPFSHTVQAPGLTTADGAAARCAELGTAAPPPHAQLRTEFVTTGLPDGNTGRVLTLPPFCRVQITARPEAESNILVELWLPATWWNGKFYGVGSGGGGGSIASAVLSAPLRRGFAVATTDLGTSPNAYAVGGTPARWTDFGFRSTHEMAVISKQLIQAFYKVPPKRSIFNGCSTGGQQALREAQDFPLDFNGIIAGAPANNRTHLHSMFVWNYQAANEKGAASRLPIDTLEYVHREIVRACKASDVGAPGDTFLTDSRTCHFNFDTLAACSQEATTSCVSPEQRQALKKIYAGPSSPTTGKQIYAGMPLGSELSGSGIISHEDPERLPKQHLYMFHWLFGPDFDPQRFDFDKQETQLDKRLARDLNANNADLAPYRNTGGKLVMFTGTADGIVPYPDAVAYYERVTRKESRLKPSTSPIPQAALAKTQQWFRYFIIPGMDHCGGGAGINTFGQSVSENGDDLVGYVERWLDGESVPAQLKGSRLAKSKVEFERPVCAYPSFPTYVGGDEKSEKSFMCKPRPAGNVPDTSAYLP